jgi:hemoglobin
MRASIIIVCVLVVIAVFCIWHSTSHSSHSTPEGASRGLSKPSLYDRLGGIYSIAAVVDHFSDALLRNPMVGVDSPNEYLRDWSRNKLSRLPGLKWMRTLWLASLSGGPYKYVATKPGKCPFSLENAHSSFRISPEEFDAVAMELSNSLDYFQVPAQEKSEVLAAFAAHKSEVNMGYDAAVGAPLPHIKC